MEICTKMSGRSNETNITNDDMACYTNIAYNDSLNIICGPMYTTYQILTPIFIAVGILINLAALAILRRTKFQDSPINRYLLVISVLNIGYNLFLIPISFTNNGCNIPNTLTAAYYARFGWALPEIMIMSRSYIIMTIAYDRFLAIYFPYYLYFRNDTLKTFKRRIACLLLFAIVMMIPVIYFASCESFQFSSSTKYIARDFYRPADLMNYVVLVLQGLVKIVTFWIPVIGLILLNTFVVVALIQRRIEKPMQVVSSVNKKESFHLTNFSLVLSMTTYLLFQLPIFFYLSNPDYTEYLDGTCHNTYEVEVFRAFGVITDWLLSILHIVPILIMNDGFKETLLGRLKTYGICIKSYGGCCRQNNSHSDDDRLTLENCDEV